MKPTFKNHPAETGLRAVGNISGADIKVKGKRVGTIIGASSFGGFKHRIQVAVKAETEKRGWRWIMPGISFGHRDQAKEWLRENFADIVAGHDLHAFDD